MFSPPEFIIQEPQNPPPQRNVVKHVIYPPIAPKPAAPPPPPAPRILNPDAANNNTSINRAQTSYTQFFEITYLPDNPSEQPRKGEIQSSFNILYHLINDEFQSF